MEAFSLAIAFLVIFLTISFFAFKNASNVNTNLPPGSSGWPIVGETFDFIINPEKFLSDRMKKHSSDIFRTNFFGEKIVIICGPNGHKFIFSNEDKYFAAYVPKSIQKLFLTTEQNTDKGLSNDVMKLPRFLALFVKPEALVNYIAGMDTIIQKYLTTHLEGKAEVKIYPFSKSITLTLACRFFLGIENPERVAKLVDQFNKVSDGMFTLPINIPGTTFYYAIKAGAVIRKELADIIEEKKARVASGAPTQDICTKMIVEGMLDEDISGKMMGLLVAGFSTIATTITTFMKFVGERPDVYNKILSEQLEISKSKQPEELLHWDDIHKMKYSWAVVCEALRIASPILGTFRAAKTDFSYAGLITVPKGWKVFWMVNTTHKNSECFQEPDKFDPSRFMEGDRRPPYSFVAFEGGPRMCPGKEYTRLVILAFIHNLVQKFKWEVVDPNEKVLGSMMPYPEKGLPVRLHRR